jgi:hypothetical protein
MIYYEPPPPVAVESRPLWSCAFPIAQGIEGQLLLEEMKKVLHQTHAPLQWTYASVAISDDVPYRHVTLPTVRKILVRYKEPERLRARCFSFEDDEK